tara:strand:+ start:1139 stop:3100 length:1962 start_codon:yes stop_codon:yes gene_type:complete
MSLIITSNVNLNDRPSTSEVHRPYNWSNRLTSTFKVEADSEIAVQSVKINKNGLLSIGPYNSNYAMYLGKNLDADTPYNLEDSTYHPYADSVVRGTSIEDLTTDELAGKMETSFKKNIMNPSFYSKTTGEPFLTVTDKATAGDPFSGFKIAVDQTPEPSDEIPADGSEQSVFETSRFTYATGVFTRVTSVLPEINSTAPRGCCAIFPDKPVLLSSPDAYPSVNYDITNAVGDGGGGALDKEQWAVGLTRYNMNSPQLSPTTGDVELFAPPYYDSRHSVAVWNRFRTMFFDYVAIKDQDGLLRLYQSCVDTSAISGDQLVMREVIYYHAGNATFKDGPYDLNVNVTKYTHLRFRVANECVICEIGKHAGGAYDILVNDKLGDKTNVFYPRSCLQNFLYPQIFIQKIGTAIKFEERHTYDALPDAIDPTKPTEVVGKFDPSNPDVDWVARLEKTGKYIKWGKPVENRTHNDFNTAYGTDLYDYSFFTDYAAGGATGGYLDDIQMNLINAPNRQYGIEYTANANSQYTFGFIGSSLAEGTYNAATGGSTLQSTTVPTLASPKSLFVRLNNLTQQTVNAQLGNAYSKIISHLPRFDSAGNDVGHLYFEPNELVYISLNNPSDVFINSFDVDIVYDNETYADCLSGKTIVVLHIRKKK